jgi:hypothetical protein
MNQQQKYSFSNQSKSGGTKAKRSGSTSPSSLSIGCSIARGDVPSFEICNIKSSVVCSKTRKNLKILPLPGWKHQNEARLIM